MAKKHLTALAVAISTLAGMAVVVACESDSGGAGGGGVFVADSGGFESSTGDAGGDACAESDELCRVRASLPTILLELPCGGHPSCTTSVQTVSRTIDGEPGATYDVQLHVTGVVELRRYDLDGNPDAGAYAGPGSMPTIPSEGYSIDSLTVSSPSQVAYLNAGPIVSNCDVLDYVFTIRVDTGATLTLKGDPVDGAEAPNTGDDGQPLLAPPHATTAYDGQFFQVEFVSATRVSK